jgi:hypothetical protein
MDHEWQIDVRKAHAIPPPPLVKPLKRIARLTRQRASDVYRHRGQVLRRKHASEYQLVWQRRVIRGSGENRITYLINRQHPLIREALSNPDVALHVKSVLELVENTLPIGGIVVDNAEHPEALARPETWESPRELQRRGLHLYEALVRDGIAPEEAYRLLVLSEPFDRAPQLLALVEERLAGYRGGHEDG